MTSNSGAIGKVVIFGTMCIALGFALAIYYQKMEPSLKPTKNSQKPYLQKITPTKTPTGAATPSATPSKSTSQGAGLIALHIDPIDYSRGHPAGLVPTAKVRLYRMDGSLIEEKLPTPHIQNGPVGTGGDAIFYVLPNTYKAEADAGNMSGTCIVDVRATTEYNSCAIYMSSKPVHLSGKYFVDTNNNGQPDGGEREMGDRTTYFLFTNSNGQTYSAGKTKTDAKGDYSIDLPYTGTFTASADYEPGYSEPRSSSTTLTGGQSATLNITIH